MKNNKEEMLKEIIRDWENNLRKKIVRCWCCEWKYFILPFAYKYLNQNKNNICDDCREELKKELKNEKQK